MLQYLSDNSGHKTAVVIPIEEWNGIKNKYPGIDAIEGELPQWQKDILDERMLLLKQHPDQVTSLEDFLTELDKEDEAA